MQLGHLVEFGYYDQHLKSLLGRASVMRAVWPPNDPNATEQRMRNLLGRFGLVGDQVNQRVGDLSGGERSRAALARLVALGVNVLVLDEPTNHLDLWACDALEQALLEFEGTCIVVSHDRYFLNRVVDVAAGAGGRRPRSGDLRQLRHLRADASAAGRRAERKDQGRAHEGLGEGVRAPPAAKPAKRKRRFPYRKVEDLEADIARGETQVRELEALLASPDLYRDGDKVKDAMKTFEEAKAKLQQLYEHWEEAVELN